MKFAEKNELYVLLAPIAVKIFSNRKLALALELEKLQQRAGGMVEEVIHFHASKNASSYPNLDHL